MSTCQEPLGGAGRPAKAAATHATRRIGAILLIIDSSPQKILLSRFASIRICHWYWSMNAAQVIQNSGSAADRNSIPEMCAMQDRNSLNRDGLNLAPSFAQNKNRLMA